MARMTNNRAVRAGFAAVLLLATAVLGSGCLAVAAGAAAGGAAGYVAGQDGD